MPLTLHPCLKRGLDHDDFYIDAADGVEDGSRETSRAEEQDAKRQRVERIAAQYLNGRLPVILTASLRGPFNDGWKNPWAEEKKPRRMNLDKEHSVRSGQAGARRGKPAEVKRRTRSAERKSLEGHAVPSPETSRAVQCHVHEFEGPHTQEVFEVPPATAPSPGEHDISGATEFFSMNTERCVKSRSPLTDPFWLRRPESQRKIDMRKTIPGNTQSSPTHARSKLPSPDRRSTLQPATPKVPVGRRTPPSIIHVPDDIRSSASASMVISSPVKPATHMNHVMVPASAPRRREATAAHLKTPGLSSCAQPAQVRSTARTSTVIPATAHKIPLTDPMSILTAQAAADTAQSSATLETDQERPTRNNIKRSAERLDDMLLASQHSDGQPQLAKEEVTSTGGRPAQPQPAPNSSTGFVYKKVGSTKWSISNAPRSKPRAVNFNSSPANKDVTTTSKPSPQTKSVVDVGAAAVEEVSECAGRTPGSQPKEPMREQQSLESRRSSRQSAMSTQAAMLLAQLEFQESTFPTSSSETPRPWSQPEEETPWPMLAEPSPAITPLSVFRPQLEQANALTSVLRGPPLSTQDLFAAASPFAVSTVKKKPEAPRRTNLRMSMMSFNSQDERDTNASSRSPSYPDRIPLKEKNTVPSPWSFSFEKELRNSQESFKRTRRSISDVELPQLDFQTSLDDYGPHGSLHFADRLLRNFDET
jgi:hypothetical protein